VIGRASSLQKNCSNYSKVSLLGTPQTFPFFEITAEIAVTPETTVTTATSIYWLISRTTWVSQQRKGKPFWILLEQEMMGWQWGHSTSNQPVLYNTPSPVSLIIFFTASTLRIMAFLFFQTFIQKIHSDMNF